MLYAKSRIALVAAVLSVVGACAGEANEERTEALESATSAEEASAQGGADADFLREMSDHHEGLVLIAEQAHAQVADDSVRSVAERMHTQQAQERDSMVAMLASMFGEQHTPTAMSQNRAQADSVAQMSGVEADRYFLETTIAHHQAGLRMIDQHLGHLTSPEVRSMAEEMRATQQREIRELEGKLQQLE